MSVCFPSPNLVAVFTMKKLFVSTQGETPVRNCRAVS
jgi:hypothetical protein